MKKLEGYKGIGGYAIKFIKDSENYAKKTAKAFVKAMYSKNDRDKKEALDCHDEAAKALIQNYTDVMNMLGDNAYVMAKGDLEYSENRMEILRFTMEECLDDGKVDRSVPWGKDNDIFTFVRDRRWKQPRQSLEVWHYIDALLEHIEAEAKK